MTSLELARKAATFLDSKKAEKLNVIEVDSISSLADYFVDHAVQPKSFKRFGIPQVYAGFGSGEDLQKKYHYHKQDVAEYIRSLKR